MRKVSESGRVILNETAKAALERMTTELTSQEACVRFTPSSLVSWIVNEYEKGSFVENKGAIIRDHFNTKEYLKKVIRDIRSPEDMATALHSMLQKVNNAQAGEHSAKRKKRKTQTTPTDQSGAAQNGESA